MELKEIEYEVTTNFQNLATDDERMRYYVRLRSDDAAAIKNKVLHAKAVSFRKNSVSTTKARELLSCTLSELNRWDEQGDVPHAFKKKIQMRKTVNARFWNIDDLNKVDVEAIRKQDSIAKKFKRSGLKVIR